MSEDRFLDREAILVAFGRLAERLDAKHLVCDIYLFGGGAMVMAFDGREATSDLDARFTSTAEVQTEIDAVGEQLGYPRWWLNEQGTSYLPRRDEPIGIFDHPNLRVMRTSERHLLAMKVRAARRMSDEADIRLLVARLGLKSVQEVEEVCDDVFPDEPLTERQRQAIRDALPS